VHAAELSGNGVLRAELQAAIAAGLPTVAECAGLLYLCRSVDGQPMVGAIDAEATMTDRLTLRYHTPVADQDSLLAAAGRRATAHEFHRTVVEPPYGPAPAWLVDGEPVGFGTETLHASYLHLHWAGHPHLAQRFADAVHAYVVPKPVTDDRDLASKRVVCDRFPEGLAVWTLRSVSSPGRTRPSRRR
jgi:cobyrinic acid a,c-diamide synthase